jgi:pimeloyl-ACP methyl ester carboxylesterase
VQLEVWAGRAFPKPVDSVTVPALVVFGTDDAVFPAPDGSVLADSITGAQSLALPGAGYGSMFEDSAQFVASLERFTG